MGLNYNLIFIETKEKDITQHDFLININSNGQVKFEEINFESLYNETHLSDNSNWGLAFLDIALIIADENYVITESVISKYKDDFPIIQLEISSTVGVSLMSYWKEGKLIRKLSEGNNEFVEMYKEMKEQIPNDVYEKLIKGDENFGENQWFESEGKDHDSIMKLLFKKYDNNVSNIFDLKWKLIEE